MAFDASSYIRLDALHSLGLGASGGDFATSTGDVCEVSALGAGAFRLRIGPRTRPDYGLAVGRTKPCTATQVGGAWRFACGDATLELQGTPLRIRLLRRDRVLLASITDETPDGRTRLPAFGKVRHAPQWVAAWALAAGEAVYGLGEKFGALDKRGQLLQSWIEEPQGVNTGGTANDVPFAWSLGTGGGAWGVLVHTTGAVIHGIGHPDWSHRTYAMVVEDEALDVFLFAGDTPAQVLRAFAEVTGAAPTLPAWSYGAWLGFGNADAACAARSVARLHERRLPCDVALLAVDASPATSIAAGEAEAAAETDAIAAMRSSGMRIGMRETPYVPASSPLAAELAASGYLLRAPTGEAYVVEAEHPSRSRAPREAQDSLAAQASPLVAMLDFTSTDACDWWRDMHELAFARGADLIETVGGEHVAQDAHAGNRDTGVRLHNAYPLLFNRCVQSATARFRPEEGHAALVCARAGWTSSHRVAVACGGDAQLDWEGLAASIRGALSWALSGGVHYAMRVPAPRSGRNGASEQAELCVRWLQAALFASHTRIELGDETPEWLLRADIEPIARKWLSFRYRLLPYLARVAAQGAREGLPVMRAMPLAFPEETLLHRHETQFMLGDALLVAPIVHADGRADIALPAGGWFDLNSRQRVTGPRVIRYRAALGQFPVFGREGHALALGPVLQRAGDIDRMRPLAQLWLFGRPAAPLEGYAQAAIARAADGPLVLRVAPDIAVERFGDAADVPAQTLPEQAS